MKKIYNLMICMAALSARAQDAHGWNHKPCAVVLTYDDAINVDIDNVLPALDSLGLKATFYHPCDGSLPGRSWVPADYDLSKYTVARAVSEIRMNNVLLNAIDGKTQRTFAYRGRKGA
jgi:peptidoglycan-N-acetylglucosamine deacetylase